MSEIIKRFATGAPQNLEERFATRAAHMKPSEIRSLFAVASRPEIVSLAGGMPNLSAFPMPMMADVIQKLVLTNGAEALVIAIQRLYLAAEDDAKTGTLRIADLRKAGIRR